MEGRVGAAGWVQGDGFIRVRTMTATKSVESCILVSLQTVLHSRTSKPSLYVAPIQLCGLNFFSIFHSFKPNVA